MLALGQTIMFESSGFSMYLGGFVVQVWKSLNFTKRKEVKNVSNPVVSSKIEPIIHPNYLKNPGGITKFNLQTKMTFENVRS